MKNNRIKGIVGLMDITKRFGWDSRHEFPVNTLDSFIFNKEYAERMSSVIFEEIENYKFNPEFHTKVEMSEIKEISSDIIRQAVFEEKLNSKTHTLVKKIVPVQAGSKIEFMFRAKGLCSAVMENLHAVVTMNLKTEEQAINLQEWLLSQEKWFIRNENCVQFKLDAISNVSGARDNVVSRLLSGAYEMYGTLDNETFSFTREEVKNMSIKTILEKNKEYFENPNGLHKVTIGYFINDNFIPLKDSNKNKVEFDMYILMDFAYQLATHNASARAKSKTYDKFYFDYITTIKSKTNNKGLLDKMINHKISGNYLQRFIIAGNMELINEEGEQCL